MAPVGGTRSWNVSTTRIGLRALVTIRRTNSSVETSAMVSVAVVRDAGIDEEQVEPLRPQALAHCGDLGGVGDVDESRCPGGRRRRRRAHAGGSRRPCGRWRPRASRASSTPPRSPARDRGRRRTGGDVFPASRRAWRAAPLETRPSAADGEIADGTPCGRRCGRIVSLHGAHRAPKPAGVMLRLPP